MIVKKSIIISNAELREALVNWLNERMEESHTIEDVENVLITASSISNSQIYSAEINLTRQEN